MRGHEGKESTNNMGCCHGLAKFRQFTNETWHLLFDTILKNYYSVKPHMVTTGDRDRVPTITKT